MEAQQNTDEQHPSHCKEFSTCSSHEEGVKLVTVKAARVLHALGLGDP